MQVTYSALVRTDKGSVKKSHKSLRTNNFLFIGLLYLFIGKLMCFCLPFLHTAYFSQVRRI